MRLGIRLAAIGLVLLTAKTHHPLSNAYLSDTQVVSERRVVYPGHLGYAAQGAEGKHPKSLASTYTCPANPERSDAIAAQTAKSSEGAHG